MSVALDALTQGVESAQAAYDRLAPVYDSAFVRAVDLAENRTVFETIAALPGWDEGEVLDLGCGTGLLLDYTRPAQYWGIDFSRGMLQQARAKHGHKRGCFFALYDMTDLCDMRDEYYSHVISTFGSLSYCLQPNRAMAEAWRVLRPGGITCHVVFSWRYYWRGSHISKDVPFIGYTPAMLRRLMQPYFRGITIQGVHGLTGFAPALMGIEARTLGRVWPATCYFLIATGTRRNDRA